MISSWLLSSQRISLRKPGSHPFCWFLTNLASFCSCWTKCWFFVPSAMAVFISYHWHSGAIPWYLWFHFWKTKLWTSTFARSLLFWPQALAIWTYANGVNMSCMCCSGWHTDVFELRPSQILGRCGHFANVKQHIFKRRTLSTQRTKIQYKLLEICA